jgi:hypothetical protein
MALSGSMVPSFCRNRPWTCFGICVQAIEWRMSPFALAREAYEVENRRTQETTVAFTSKVQHAVIEARAPIKQRLAVRYEGTGDDMVCIVSGTFKNETEPREWRSERLADRRPKPEERMNRQTKEKYTVTPGSPLWQSKPQVQLFYDTSRDWIRVYCPDVSLGLYGRDELDEANFEPAPPASPATPTPPPGTGSVPEDGGLQSRLSEAALKKMGFQFDHQRVAAEIDANGAKPDNGDQGAVTRLADEAPAPLVPLEAAEADSPAADGGPPPSVVPPDGFAQPSPDGQEPAQPSEDLLGDKPRQRAAKRAGGASG